jgi:hypothetical protein
MTRILIGLDDTDNATSKGTGHLARLLITECASRGMQPQGVTRHQFHLDPRIPYTSHNSGACVAVVARGGAEEAEFAFDFVASRSAEGSDPGVCIAVAERITPQLVEFGWAATSRVVEMGQAFDLARQAGIPLRALGGTGLGVIGALASAALRADGNEGRFIDLPGLRELPDSVDAAAFGVVGIRLEHYNAGRTPVPGDAYRTLGWARPRLIGGQAVLPVQWSDEYNAWIPADRKKSRPLE